MPGLPGDTPATAVATLRRTLALRPDFLRIYPTLVIAGTELEAMYRRGEYSPLELPAAVRLCKVMLHEALRGFGSGGPDRSPGDRGTAGRRRLLLPARTIPLSANWSRESFFST